MTITSINSLDSNFSFLLIRHSKYIAKNTLLQAAFSAIWYYTFQHPNIPKMQYS